MNLLTRWKLIAGLACSVVLLSLGMVPLAQNGSEPSFDLSSISLEASTKDCIATHISIEDLQVGQRVLTGLPSDELRETQVDSTKWKKLTLTAEWTWSDGTLDVFHIQTLQPPEWMQATNAQLGSRVPMPLDVTEMGCPDNLLATVDQIEPCPQIQHAPGRVILTTVNHLNPACLTLEVRAEDGTTEKIHTTDFHPFWSETKQDWVKAYRLAVGERLSGTGNHLLTLTASSRLPGIHAVYNFTVEKDNTYRVGKLSALVHNNSCKRMKEDHIALKDLVTEATNGGRKPLSVPNAEATIELATKVEYPGFRVDADDLAAVDNHWVGGPHLHMGGVKAKDTHIAVDPGVTPPPLKIKIP